MCLLLNYGSRIKGWTKEVLSAVVIEFQFTLIPGFQPFKD